jgi:hypothetical protein
MSHSHEVLMVSHAPIDYHIHSKLNGFHLVESHTGQVRTVQELGRKVFKKDIPFNKYTHACLGDKDYIKSPLSLKQKKDLCTVAEQRHWNIRTLNDIRADITKLGVPILVKFD